MAQAKSDTDRHWDHQAATVETDGKVNIHDPWQREFEHQFLMRHLSHRDRVLEVGCGNGYSSNSIRDRVAHLDSFDYSEAMIERAKRVYGESNNRFFTDNVIEPKQLEDGYDKVVCVRVLINLRNLAEQTTALETMTSCVRPGGMLLLVEGFSEGFEELNLVRSGLRMPDLVPAKINFYSRRLDVLSLLCETFRIVDSFHSGTYDYLTRVVYPYLVGPDNVSANSVEVEKYFRIATESNIEGLGRFARVYGFALEKTS